MGFPGIMSDTEIERWISIADSEELEACKRSSYARQRSDICHLIKLEQDRRISREIINSMNNIIPPPWHKDRNFWVGIIAVLAASLSAYFAWVSGH